MNKNRNDFINQCIIDYIKGPEFQKLLQDEIDNEMVNKMIDIYLNGNLPLSSIEFSLNNENLDN